MGGGSAAEPGNNAFTRQAIARRCHIYVSNSLLLIKNDSCNAYIIYLPAASSAENPKRPFPKQGKGEILQIRPCALRRESEARLQSLRRSWAKV